MGRSTEPERVEIDVAGCTLSALVWGRPDHPAVILLHGFPDTAWTWRHLGPELARLGWRVIAPFTRGYAPSSLAHDGTYEIGAFVADILAVREAFAPDQKPALVGHDFGAFMVSAIASVAPENFSSATLLALPPTPVLRSIFRHKPLSMIRQSPRAWYMIFFQMPGLAERIGPALFDLLWRNWAPGYDSTTDRAALHAALPDVAHRRAAITYYRALLNPLYRQPRYEGRLAGALNALRLPTLYLHGNDDTCGRADLGERALDYLPAGSKRIVIPRAGHFLHLERPGTVNELIGEWLARTGEPGPVIP